MAPYSNGNADFAEILNFFICTDDAFCDGCDSTQASVVLVRHAHPGNPVSRERKNLIHPDFNLRRVSAFCC
jgi:hypothetical protein